MQKIINIRETGGEGLICDVFVRSVLSFALGGGAGMREVRGNP